MRVGKMSVFGGIDDKGMTDTEGLALYEHQEADIRPDLFNPRIGGFGTARRLKDGAYYLACRYDLKASGVRRAVRQLTPYVLHNPKNGKVVVASLVDWGPNERTGREFDVSPGVAAALGVDTDDVIEGWEVGT